MRASKGSITEVVAGRCSNVRSEFLSDAVGLGGILLAEARGHEVLVPHPDLSRVERADDVHISADVAGEVDGGADARGAVAPVDEAEHHGQIGARSEEHTSELQSRGHLVCRLLLEKKNLLKRCPDRPGTKT